MLHEQLSHLRTVPGVLAPGVSARARARVGAVRTRGWAPETRG